MKTAYKVLIGLASVFVLIIVLGTVIGIVDPEGTASREAERKERAAAKLGEREANRAGRAAARDAEKLAEANKADADERDAMSDEYPRDQHQFHAMNKACNPRYDEGINEIQKSIAFNQCNSERREFANGRSIVGWVGKITSIETDQGADVVSLEVFAKVDGFKIGYTTMPNRISDASAKTLIRPGTPLFEKVSNLREGQTVAFDADFVPDSERGVEERSLTEKGALRSPVFAIRFTDVRPYDPAVGAVKANEASFNNSVDSVEAASQESAGVVPNQPLSEVVGMYYLHGKTVLREAGYSPDTGAGTSHTVDSDPADCGNAGCSAPWVNKEGDHICVGIRVDDSQEESRWEIVSAQPGSCG